MISGTVEILIIRQNPLSLLGTLATWVLFVSLTLKGNYQ